jgi:hypothetical protein
VIDAIKRLHADARVRLRKWVDGSWLEYQGTDNDGEFFDKGNGFWLLITPQGKPYYDALQSNADDEPKPKRPIGF